MAYSYLDLTTPQKHARRVLLDRTGTTLIFTQLLLFALYRLSPLLPRPAPIRRLHALLTTPLSSRYPALQSPGSWIAITTYLVWCVYVSARSTAPDYLHLTKSLGMAAAANLPLHFLLATKRVFPALSRRSYERNVFAHTWTGRIIAALMTGHVLLYLNFFYDTNRMGTRFWENDVQCGVWAAVVWYVLAASAWEGVRRWSYKLFFAVHACGAPLVFPMLGWHVSHLRPYLYGSIGVWVVDTVWRVRSRVSGTAKVRVLGEGLVGLEIACERRGMKAGCHVRMIVPGVSQLHANPFTVAAVGEKGVKVVMRVRGGVTKVLAEMEKVEVVLEGPYGVPEERTWERLLVIAGGVGGTYAVPAVAEAMAQREEGVRFVWVVKSVEDCVWGLEDKKVAGVVEVYVTGRKERGEEIELEDEDVVERLGALGVAAERVHFGRPNLKAMVQELGVEAGRKEVVCCGPEEMGAVVRSQVGKLRMRVPVGLHVEEFGH